MGRIGTRSTVAALIAAMVSCAPAWGAGCPEATQQRAGAAELDCDAAATAPPAPTGDTAGTTGGAANPTAEAVQSAQAGEPELRRSLGEEGDPALVSPDAQGARELALAQRLLDEGEQATDDAARREKYKAASVHADRAIALLPSSADAHFVRFGAVGRLAQLDGLAVAAFKLSTVNADLDEVLRLDPNHADALAARGGMLVKLPRLLGGDTARGIEYLERAVALDETAVGKRLELAEAYHIVGRDDDARRTAERALAVARERDDPARIATCERFIAELHTACAGCAMASIGR